MFLAALTSFAIQIAIAVVIALVAYALMPKPKSRTADMARDLEMPTAEAGRPVPVVFGNGTLKSPNTLWYGEPNTVTVEIDA